MAIKHPLLRATADVGTPVVDGISSSETLFHSQQEEHMKRCAEDRLSWPAPMHHYDCSRPALGASDVG
jgi:hypothetical protein